MKYGIVSYKRMQGCPVKTGGVNPPPVDKPFLYESLTVGQLTISARSAIAV